MMIVFESDRALGQDPEALAISWSTIRRLRRKHREAAANGIVDVFKRSTALTVHWDGKLMPDLTGQDKVDRLPTLVSTMGEKKLLGIPKIPAGTGQIKAQAVQTAICEWKLENLVRGMCFDTTSSNTVRLSGLWSLHYPRATFTMAADSFRLSASRAGASIGLRIYYLHGTK